MIRFLLQRPIAVFMAFTAFFILGFLSYFTLPISLLPDIAIPEITVQITGTHTSARELENTVVGLVRRQLQQVSHVRHLRSETRDESSLIRLSFDYGVNTDLAFIEVNEKIDAVMSMLPREVERPRVVKASATDIPVFNLHLSLQSDQAFAATDADAFLLLGEFADMVIKRRIEQLPEVAMVDVTGLPVKQLLITPDMARLDMLGIGLQDLEAILVNNNIELGSMLVRDGYYEYNIKFTSVLRTLEDVEQIYVKTQGHLLQLKDLAKVEVVQQKEKGVSMADGKRAITLSIIKQADANMRDLQRVLGELTERLKNQYPNISFTVAQNQTELLDFTITNLTENLLLGFILVCFVSIFFMQSIRTPLVIGVSVFVSLVISLLFFALFHVSLNIVSLAGLILAVGMMIDNSIIVTDNITQYREMGYSPTDACAIGTEEVMIPMLSSMFTTIAVFVPLVFMSGIAGAIFFDQAFAVATGLLSSYFTGILLLPVLYRQLYLLPESKNVGRLKQWLGGKDYLGAWYDAGIRLVFSHKTISVALLIVALPICVLLFRTIGKDKMPVLERNELLMLLDWNENIHVGENLDRTNNLLENLGKELLESSVLIGQQQFLLRRDRSLSSSETEIYLKTAQSSQIKTLENTIIAYFKERYPKAIVSFAPPPTVFEKIFVTGEPDLLLELYARNPEAVVPDSIVQLQQHIAQATGLMPEGVSFKEQLKVYIDREKLLLYKVAYAEVYKALKTAFKDNKVTNLHSFQQYLPIVLGGTDQSISEIIDNTLIYTESREQVPLQHFIRIVSDRELKTITAGVNGEFIPLAMYTIKDEEQTMSTVGHIVKQSPYWDYSFSGSLFQNQQMMNEMVIVLLVSLMLMYFILAAQFESLMLPLIVLIEIPIDAAAALFFLYILGHTLNIMSAIGIIVTCGIVINDSILKISMINELRKQGVPLLEAIHEAGHRRLRSILMTSLTTILAMVPLLFSFDIGSELQKPLAISTISAMIIGTIVSLLVIPLVYWLIYKDKVVKVEEGSDEHARTT